MPESWSKTGNAFLYSGNHTGSAYVNSEALTDVSPGAATEGQAFFVGRDCPLLVVGSLVRVTATGIVSVSGTPKITVGFYWGGVAGVVLAETEVEVRSGVTNASWQVTGTIRITEKGASGHAVTQGVVSGSLLAATATPVVFPRESATGGESTINTEVAKALTLGAQWKTKSASNSLTVYQWIIETLTAPT